MSVKYCDQRHAQRCKALNVVARNVACLVVRVARVATGLAACLVLSACASFSAMPPAPGTIPSRSSLSDFSLEGRFALRNEAESASGRLSWQHEAGNNEVLLSSPLGQGLAEISTNQAGAQLTMRDGKVYSAATAEALTLQVLGYPLPIVQLAHWVRGEHVADQGRVERDAQQRPLVLRHEDWTVKYSYDSDAPDAPPMLIFFERAAGISLRLRVDEWRTLPPKNAPPAVAAERKS